MAVATQCGPGGGPGADPVVMPVHLEQQLGVARYQSDSAQDLRPLAEPVERDGRYRQALVTFAPGELGFPVLVPQAGRLDVALATRGKAPVSFEVEVRGDGDGRVVLQHRIAGETDWSPQSADLSEWAGEPVELVLRARSPVDAAEAIWGSPTVSGAGTPGTPNVVFYVIDAAGADFMSLYDHERDTTPFLRELARDGVVFERAYSSSTWTKISTPSFLASLHSSVLGGYRDQRDRIAASVETLPERLHGTGYQTASITSNAFAGSMTGLESGVDLLRDVGVEPNSVSSVELHSDFWAWRDRFPGLPFYTHFQTTDVHWPWYPVEPFLGTFTSAEERERFYAWEEELAAATGLERPQWLHAWRYPEPSFETTGIDRLEFFSIAERLYDETMLHQDQELRELVEELRRRGIWENTLLIVASDHSSAHGLGSLESIPDRDGPIMSSMRTRVPLLFVWPAGIEGERRVETPVSMLDVLPTVLDLLDLPQPEVVQGRSLAAALSGEELEPALVTLDELYVAADETLGGWLEVIDGRWGASWRFQGLGPGDSMEAAAVRLCDLREDPLCLEDVASDHPEIRDRLAAEIQRRWDAHMTLARRFGSGDPGEMTPEQLETLRALGYVQ